MSIQTAANASFGIETYARIVVVLVSAGQSLFYYFQRQKGHCGWEKLYTTVAETITYIIVAALGSAAVVTVSGRPWMWPRYAGWLSTCPVLLIDVSMVPMPAARRPALAMTSILAQQLMVLLGMTSIFYDNIYLRTSIFLAAVAFGLFAFKIVAETFVRAWGSFPEKEPQMRSWLLISAGLFFVGWTCFPVLFIAGLEGFGSLSGENSALLHAFADLIAKNGYSYASWYLRWVVIREYLDRCAEETAELEARKLKAIKDAEAGITAEVGPPGQDPAMANMAAVVAALAAEERELQRPIDVADVISAASGITIPALQEVFAAMVDTACLTTPGVLASILPAALDRAEAVRIRVVIIDNSPTRQAAASRRVRSTEAANALGIVVRFAFRPRDVARLRAAQGGQSFHAVVLTDDSLFSACADPTLDERTRTAAVGAHSRTSGGVSHAPFSASFAERQASEGVQLTDGRTLGSFIGATSVSVAGESSDSGYESGRRSLAGAGSTTSGEESAGRGSETRLGRMDSALAMCEDDEDPLGAGPRSTLQAIREMAAGKEDVVVVVVAAGTSRSSPPRNRSREVKGYATPPKAGASAARASLHDVGADMVISAMGRVREWNEAMNWVGDVAEDRIGSPDRAFMDGVDAGHTQAHLQPIIGEHGNNGHSNGESGISGGWKRRSASETEDEGSDHRRRRWHSGGGSQSGSGTAQSRRDGDGTRRRQGRGSREMESSDDNEDDRDSSASGPRTGGGMPEIDDATGATQLLAEAVRSGLDASSRAVLPQSLARLVSGVAKSADAIVLERVKARQEADERREAEGLFLGGAEPVGMTMFDAGVALVPRSELESVSVLSGPADAALATSAPAVPGYQVQPAFRGASTQPGDVGAGRRSNPSQLLPWPMNEAARRDGGAGRNLAPIQTAGHLPTPSPPTDSHASSAARADGRGSLPHGRASAGVWQPDAGHEMRRTRGGRRGSMDNMADAIGKAFKPN